MAPEHADGLTTRQERQRLREFVAWWEQEFGPVTAVEAAAAEAERHAIEAGHAAREGRRPKP